MEIKREHHHEFDLYSDGDVVKHITNGVLVEQHGPDVTAYIGTTDPKVLFLAIEAIQAAIHGLGLTEEYAYWLSKVYRHPEFELTDFSKYLQPIGIEPGTTIWLPGSNEFGLTQIPKEGDSLEL